jgi:hypothetical protein
MKINFTSLNRKDSDRSTGIRQLSGEKTEEIIDRAVKKCYGKKCFFSKDNGLHDGNYGQIFEALRPTKNNSQPGNSSVTGRIRIDIE